MAFTEAPGPSTTAPMIEHGIRLFDLLTILAPDVTPVDSKIHLATWDGDQDPYDVFLAGHFNEWQSWQSKRNFERRFIVSLISLGGSRWLFAGLYTRRGVHWIAEDPAHWQYELDEDPRCSGLKGRLIVSHERRGRAAYRDADSCALDFTVLEIKPSPIAVASFPGYKSVLLSRAQLRIIVKETDLSWQTALSSVGGVYLITDTKTGKLYVGCATGEGGIWGRWTSYAANGHGGNAELQTLLALEGPERANFFQYSVLEIADTHTSPEDVQRRETHWKKVLMSRTFGLNAN